MSKHKGNIWISCPVCGHKQKIQLYRSEQINRICHCGSHAMFLVAKESK